MGVSKFPRHYSYQTFGMSQRLTSIDSTESETDVDQCSDGECGAPLDVSDGQSSPTDPALPDDSHLGRNESSEEDGNRNFGTKGGILLEQILFFLAGLGSSIGYIATLSSLVYFKVLFGANSFVYLNCAVFLPLLPISVAQAIWDSKFDLLYFSRVTFLVRCVLGYGFVVSGTIGMVIFSHRSGGSGLEWVICWALLQGIGGAVLFGQLNQLASFVGSLHQYQTPETTSGTGNASHDDTMPSTSSDESEMLPKKFKATVSAGVQASALVVLLASITSGFGTMNAAYFSKFLVRILQVEVLCFVAFLWLLVARPRIQVSFLRRDSSMRELNRYSSEIDEFQELLSPWQQNDDSNDVALRSPLLPRSTSSGDTSNQDTNEPTMLSLRSLFYHSKLSCIGMALTLVPSFLVGSWFTRVQTDWMELAQILFYVRIGSDLVGRFATILMPPPSIKCVIATAGLRCIAVVAFFFNAETKIPLGPWDRDALSICLVAFIAFFSGYLVTSCYQLAPQELPMTPLVRSANVAKQSSLLTVAFSVSAIGGLVTSFVLISIGA